jgi:nicotinamidase-related amidase
MSTPFQAWFKDAPVYQNYIICGCVTDICILHFALSLNSYFHEHDIDTKVSVLIDGVATYHVEFHDRETYHQSALNLMSQVGIHLIESESLRVINLYTLISMKSPWHTRILKRTYWMWKPPLICL